MKTTKILTTLILSFGFIICLADISKAEPMSTAFTYQGHLYDNDIVSYMWDLDDSNSFETDAGGQAGLLKNIQTFAIV